MLKKTIRSTVKRVPKRGHYDLETIYRVLDQNYICHVCIIIDGYPVVIPTYTEEWKIKFLFMERQLVA